MKVAILFSGQYREINNDLFRKSLSILLKNLDYSIFSFCWDQTGPSLNHSKNIPDLRELSNTSDIIKKVFNDFNLEKYDSESFLDFKKNLPKNINYLFNSNAFHKGTINSIPQIYTLYKCFNFLKNSTNNFDLVFRCRYDSFFIHPLNFFPLEEIAKNNHIYNLNFGRSYYPKRIYDIFFGGSYYAMSFLSNIWDNLPNLIENKFNNGLDKRDCCRILFLSAKNNNIKVKSLRSRICDVFRSDENFNYENYLISSHFLSFKFSKKKFASLSLFIKWCFSRGITKKNIILNFLKSLIFMPFSYLKRFRYLINIFN